MIERQPKKRVTYRIVVITAAVVLKLQVVLFHRRRQRRRRRNEKKGSDFCRARQKKFVLLNDNDNNNLQQKLYIRVIKIILKLKFKQVTAEESKAKPELPESIVSWQRQQRASAKCVCVCGRQ